MRFETLEFTLRRVRDHAGLQAARSVRSRAYGRHLPAWREPMLEPDLADAASGARVLLCRAKADGEPIGTLRLQCSDDAPLAIDAGVCLPAALQRGRRVEATRFAVPAGAPPLVRAALMKACYWHCRARAVDWIVIGARHPALIRIYLGLGFADVHDDARLVPLAHAGGLPHRILALDVRGAAAAWRAAGHRWTAFMLETFHPDIEVDDALELPAAAPHGVPGRLPRRERAADSPLAA